LWDTYCMTTNEKTRRTYHLDPLAIVAVAVAVLIIMAILGI
jgi:preprotein translocase subunit Sec61beta